MNEKTPASELKLLRPKQIERLLGCSSTSLWRWAQLPDFPRPIRIGKRAIAYREDEIIAWLEQRQLDSRERWS
jgi:prophage regulatory protein